MEVLETIIFIIAYTIAILILPILILGGFWIIGEILDKMKK